MARINDKLALFWKMPSIGEVPCLIISTMCSTGDIFSQARVTCPIVKVNGFRYTIDRSDGLEIQELCHYLCWCRLDVKVGFPNQAVKGARLHFVLPRTQHYQRILNCIRMIRDFTVRILLVFRTQQSKSYRSKDFLSNVTALEVEYSYVALLLNSAIEWFDMWVALCAFW